VTLPSLGQRHQQCISLRRPPERHPVPGHDARAEITSRAPAQMRSGSTNPFRMANTPTGTPTHLETRPNVSPDRTRHTRTGPDRTTTAHPDRTRGRTPTRDTNRRRDTTDPDPDTDGDVDGDDDADGDPDEDGDPDRSVTVHPCPDEPVSAHTGPAVPVNTPATTTPTAPRPNTRRTPITRLPICHTNRSRPGSGHAKHQARRPQKNADPPR
jgi:hypothetical protein